MSAVVEELSSAIQESPVAAAVIELSSMTVLTANAAALDLIGLDVEPVGSNVLGFATDPELVGAPLRMVANGTILGYEATVSLRHVDGGSVELLARVVAVPAHDDLAVAVAAATHSSVADVELGPAHLLPFFAGTLGDEATWDDLTDGAEVLRVVADELAGVPSNRRARLQWTEDLTSRQWEIVARLLRGERVPSIADALFISQSTVRNHLHVVFAKAGVCSQAELIALIRRGANGTE